MNRLMVLNFSLKKSFVYSLDPGTKHEAHDPAVCSIHKLLKSQPQPAYYLFRHNGFTISFTKTFIMTTTSCDTLAISSMDFRHDHCT